MSNNGQVIATLTPAEITAAPHHAPLGPVNMAGLGGRLVQPSTGMSTVAAQQVMDQLYRICMETAVESTDAVLEKVAKAAEARWDELEQSILQMPSRVGYINRDQVLALVRLVRSRPARLS